MAPKAAGKIGVICTRLEYSSAVEQRNDNSRNRPSWGPARYLRAGLAGQKYSHWTLKSRGLLMAPKAAGKIGVICTRLQYRINSDS